MVNITNMYVGQSLSKKLILEFQVALIDNGFLTNASW